jgi:integrase/recombinase XerD
MRSTHSFSVDFILRKCKGDEKHGLIYARITVDGEKREISIKEKVECNEWDGRREMVKGKGQDIQGINAAIEDVRFRIREKYRMLSSAGSLITAEAVKDAYLGVHTMQKGRRLIELTEYFRKIWEPKLREGGFKNYRTTIDYINRFLASQNGSGDMYLSQLNMQLATEFEFFVRNNPVKTTDPCIGNGLSKHIQRFKRIINWGVEIEWLPNNPFEKYSCPVKKNKRKKLSLQQLVTLEEKVFQTAALNYVKDIFLFSCYTGLAFVDVMQLTPEHFEYDGDGKVWCKVYRMKSDVLSPVPLLGSAMQIMAKYKDEADAIKRRTIFPNITNQYVNRCLKNIREICEFDIPITFHVARHTFAKTVALKNGVPLESVQIMMGHSKIATTQIYADVDEEKILEDMSGVESVMLRKKSAVKCLM